MYYRLSSFYEYWLKTDSQEIWSSKRLRMRRNKRNCDQENIVCERLKTSRPFNLGKPLPCHDFGWSRGQVFISLAMHGAKVGNFFSNYIYFLQYHMSVICCHWIWLGKKQLNERIFCKINRTRRPFYTIPYVSSRKTTQKWFPKMSFSFKPPQQDHPALWYLSNLSGKFHTSYFLYF